MAVIDVVRFDGLRSRDWLIYKYPSEELVLGTQVIVQEGQVAIFTKKRCYCGRILSRNVYARNRQFANFKKTGQFAVWRKNPV